MSGVIALGFAFSIVGDYLLAHQKGNPMRFVAGVGGFFLAHVCFLIYAAHAARPGVLSAVVAAALVIGYSVKARGIARDLFGAEEGHLIPVQELSGEHELIAAYDALIRRAQEERAFLTERLPAYMGGREETIDAVMALAR